MHLCLKLAVLNAGSGRAAVKPVWRTLLLAGGLTLLGACGDSAGDIAAQTSAPGAPAHLQTSADQTTAQTGTRTKSVTVGSMGGSLRLDDRTGAVYSIELRDGAAFLQGVAVLRGEQRGWYNNNVSAAPTSMRNPGIGGSLGQHLVVITPKADALWLDDQLEVSLADANVILFEGAGSDSGNISQISSLSIDSYLGPAPIDNPKQRKALIQERLAELLKNATATNAAWSS